LASVGFGDEGGVDGDVGDVLGVGLDSIQLLHLLLIVIQRCVIKPSLLRHPLIILGRRRWCCCHRNGLVPHS
jgi:hypothetical protein